MPGPQRSATARLIPALPPARLPGAANRREVGKLLRLGGPIAAISLLNMGMSTTDMVMMGWLGSLELAAGAVIGDFYSLLFYFAAGVLAAVAPMIAQDRGADERAPTGAIVVAGLIAAVGLGAVGSAIMWLSGDVMAAIGVDGRLLEAGRPYAQAMSATFVAMMFVALWRNVFSAHDKPTVFMWFTLAALPLNGLGNYLLMYGAFGIPALGVAGVGLSSFAVALLLMAGLSLYAAWSGPILRGWRDLAAVPGRLRELFRVGLPIGVTSIGEVGVFLSTTVVIGVFSAEAVAAHAIVLRIAGFIYAPIVALAQAATIRTAFAVGTGETRRRLCVEVTATVAAWLLGIIFLVVCMLFAADLPWLFLSASDPAAVSVATTAAALFMILAVLEFTEVPGATALGILRGHKDTHVPMLLTVASFWGAGFLPGLVLAFAAGLGAYGMWIGLTMGTACSTLCELWRHGSLRRRLAV